MRNDVPGGAEGLLVPPAGVAKAGGARARVLIELRAQIRAIEQVPVSLANPPAPGTALPRPACSLSSPTFSVKPAQARRAARAEARSLPRWPRGARFCPCHDCRAGGRAGERPGSRAVVPHQERRAGMGTPLWGGLARLRPRPGAVSHRRGQNGRGRRLGPRRGAEEPGVRGRLGASRDQGAARRPPSQPCRAGRAHAVPASFKPSATGASRHPHPLAHRGKEKC